MLILIEMISDTNTTAVLNAAISCALGDERRKGVVPVVSNKNMSIDSLEEYLPEGCVPSPVIYDGKFSL